MTESQALLREYAQNGTERAFHELVGRYVDFAYSTAVRLTDGNSQIAEDVVQTVFIRLARDAGTLSESVMLGGWIHRQVFHTATKAMRGERRRVLREQQAVERSALMDASETDLHRIAPVLDEAVTRLGREDQLAISLRFFEQQGFQEIGLALQITEDAARMRVNRALDKLRTILKRRGLSISSAALGAALTASVNAAPSGLAVKVAAAALAGSGMGLGFGGTLLKTLTMTKIQAGLIGSAFLLGMGASWFLHLASEAKQSAELASLRQRLDRFQDENRRLQSQDSAAANPGDTNAAIPAELLKLRGEVGLLKRELAEAKRIQTVAAAPSGAKAEAPDPAAFEQQQGLVKLNDAREWMIVLLNFAEKHQGLLPRQLEEAASIAADVGMAKVNSSTNRFEVVYAGKLEEIPEPAKTIVIRETEPWLSSDGLWLRRTYGFGDGHTEIHRSANQADMESWEAQRKGPAPGVPNQPR